MVAVDVPAADAIGEVFDKLGNRFGDVCRCHVPQQRCAVCLKNKKSCWFSVLPH